MSSPRLSRLVIATHNRKKAGEMIQILSQRFPGLELLTLADYPDAHEPDETGSTYAENAAIKAESAAGATGEWALADDAGLEIDALGGEPGLWSKRFAGEGTPFSDKMRKILALLRDVPEAERGARFRCCVALAAPTSGVVLGFPEPPSPLPTSSSGAHSSPQGNGGSAPSLFEAACEGRIADEPSGTGGFGYDPIFYLPDRGCTMADLSAEVKHSISHRGKVLELLGDYLEANFELSAPDSGR